MPKKPLYFTIQIPVKPYVRKFLETNFGNPVNFNGHPEDIEFFNRMVSKKCQRWDSKIPDALFVNLDLVDILISEDFLYRYGWEMTKTNTIRFGKHYEIRVKVFMRMFIGTATACGMQLRQSIRKFQSLYEFSEDDWNYEAIKKDFYRHAPKTVIEFDTQISQRIEKILLENLYGAGTISHQIIKLHERNSKTL